MDKNNNEIKLPMQVQIVQSGNHIQSLIEKNAETMNLKFISFAELSDNKTHPQFSKFSKNTFVVFEPIQLQENQSEENEQDKKNQITYEVHYLDNGKWNTVSINMNELIDNDELLKYVDLMNKKLSELYEVQYSKVNSMEEFLSNVISVTSKFLEQNKEEIQQLDEILKKNLMFPILKGRSWIPLLKLLNNKKVNIYIYEMKNFGKSMNQNKEDEKIKNFEFVFKNMTQYVIRNEEENTGSILFTTSNGGSFKLSEIETIEELPGISNENSFVIENYERFNFGILIRDINIIMDELKKKIFNNKKDEIPNTFIEIFTDRKYRDIQIKCLTESFKLNNVVQIPIILVGSQINVKKSSFMSDEKILVFEFKETNVAKLQEFVYGLIDKYYVGNVEIKINLKKLVGELVDSLLNQGGIVGQLQKQVKDVFDEINSYLQIFKTSFNLIKKVTGFIKAKTQKVRVSEPSTVVAKPSSQSQSSTQTQKQNSQSQKSNQDKEFELIFAPQTQSKININDNEVEQIVESKINELPFSKILKD